MRLDDCLTRAAGIWPDRVATRYQGGTRTWSQVDADVKQLAARSHDLGLVPGDWVALLGEIPTVTLTGSSPYRGLAS